MCAKISVPTSAKQESPKAAFARELSKVVVELSSKVSTRNLDQLLKTEGTRAGAHHPAFYAGYVFFEKMRVRCGEKKSAKKEKMEEMWKGKGEFPRDGSHNMRLFLVKGEKWKLDQYGQIQIGGMPTAGAISRRKELAGDVEPNL